MTNFVSITIDYETWQPIPPGKSINWERDVFDSTDRLFETVESVGAHLTLMAEMGEFFWLTENEPATADRMREQWRQALQRGHDVQLHLHPSWLPELGARCVNGRWCWDTSKAKAADYPGDLAELIGRCKRKLEETLQPIDPEYETIAFRAGTYQVQPFRRLFDALVANGIIADSSLFAGGWSPERGYDFRLAYSSHQPYFANPFDPQLKAPPAESRLVELPVFTVSPDQRWFLDNDEGRLIFNRFAKYQRQRSRNSSYPRIQRKADHLLNTLYSCLKPWRKRVNQLLPRKIAHRMTGYRPERLVEQDYFVMIGHTKAELDHAAIADRLTRLRGEFDVEFVTLSRMARMALDELQRSTRCDPAEEARYQIKRKYHAVMGEVRNDAQSHRLQEMVPMDRTRLLDLGCGAGYWSERLAQLYPWMKITGVDCGVDLIEKANRLYASSGCQFFVGDFSELAFDDNSFDCIYADNKLEHAYDPSQTLREAYRVLAEGGVLVAAIPSDARNPQRVCDNHTWKTVRHEVEMRLADTGFVDIRIDEIDTYRELGMAPFPPSLDRMMYIHAWKRRQPAGQLNRAREVMDWLYKAVEPASVPGASQEPRAIIRSGRGLCLAYTIVLGTMLRAEGMDVEWLTMWAEDHSRGHGPRRIDTHEAIVLRVDEKEVLLDPTTNVYLPYSLDDILAVPELAAAKTQPDERYKNRNYQLYCTDYWYRRVFQFKRRKKLSDYHRARTIFNRHQRRNAA